MKRTLLIILSVMGAAGLASVQAQLIDVNFIDGHINVPNGGDVTPPPGTTMVGAAVLGSANDIWNDLGGFTYAAGGAASASGRALVYANGSASGVSLSLAAPSGTYGANSAWWNNFSPFSWASLANENGNIGGPNTPYSALYAHCLVANSAAGNGNVTLTGLALNQAYQLVVYNGSDQNETAGRLSSFTVNGVTQTSTYDGVTSTLVNGVDYTMFNTTSDGSGNLVINFGNLGVSESDLNGFQLQAVPEPGTLALLGMGLGLPFYFLRRRNS